MATFVLSSVGRIDSTEVYNLFKDEQLVLGNVTHREGMDYVLKESRLGDHYQEHCEDDIRKQTVEKLWKSYCKLQEYFGNFSTEQTEQWLVNKKGS